MGQRVNASGLNVLSSVSESVDFKVCFCSGYFGHYCGDSLTQICCFQTEREGGQDGKTDQSVHAE